MKVAFTIIAGLLLCACTRETSRVLITPVTVPAQSVWEEREPDSCGARDVAALLGQKAAMVEASHLMTTYRVIRKGGIVSQEYNASRLNFYLDEAGTVARIACG